MSSLTMAYYPPVTNIGRGYPGHDLSLSTSASQSTAAHRQAHESTSSRTEPTPIGMDRHAMATIEREKAPDWSEFYRNGLPQEVIVIDDTPEPVVPTKATPHTNTNAIPPAKRRRVSQNHQVQPVPPLLVPKTQEAISRRAVGYLQPALPPARQNVPAPVHLDWTVYPSLRPSPHTIYHSQNSHHESTIGQKRKRDPRQGHDPVVHILQQTAGAGHRRIRKACVRAKDVPLRSEGESGDRSSPGEKLCDESGHYVVIPDAPLTRRCRSDLHCAMRFTDY